MRQRKRPSPRGRCYRVRLSVSETPAAEAPLVGRRLREESYRAQRRARSTGGETIADSHEPVQFLEPLSKERSFRAGTEIAIVTGGCPSAHDTHSRHHQPP